MRKKYKHEDYDRWFEPATAITAEGARVGFAACKQCGAAVLLDPRDSVNKARAHAEWHIGRGEDPQPGG